MKYKDRLRNCSRLKETKEKQDEMQCMILDFFFFATKDIIEIIREI